jgi:hypothetical protein
MENRFHIRSTKSQLWNAVPECSRGGYSASDSKKSPQSLWRHYVFDMELRCCLEPNGLSSYLTSRVGQSSRICTLLHHVFILCCYLKR